MIVPQQKKLSQRSESFLNDNYSVAGGAISSISRLPYDRGPRVRIPADAI